jgi:hypothetical protein
VSNNAAYKTLSGGFDAFVLKLNSPLSIALYLTYLGGSGNDGAEAIAVNDLGVAYVVGETSSIDFPTTLMAFDQTLGGASDAFLARVNSSGSTLVHSTYLGGSADEYASDVALDSSGAPYVAGATGSADFPVTSNGIDTALNGASDAFLAKFEATGSNLAYATFIGGSDADAAEAIALNRASEVYLTGYTSSSDFPITENAFDRIPNGAQDAFLMKLNDNGSTVAYSTHIGGNGEECGNAIVVEDNEVIFLAGETNSVNFPVTGGVFDRTFNGGEEHGDAFVSKFDLSRTLAPVPEKHGSKSGVQALNPCFIATAAYGTPMAEQVQTLCAFRDSYLLTNRAGRAFVRTYYRVSPPLAALVQSHPWCRMITRALLSPVVGLARIATTSPVIFRITFGLTGALVLSLVGSAISRARKT